MCSLLYSPPFVWFICVGMWGRGVLPATLPAPFSATLSPALSVYLCKCGAAGSARGQTACSVCPTLRQSQSRHGHVSSLRPGCPSPPLLPVWMNVYFLFPWCRTSLPFDFSVSSGCVRGCHVSTYAAILVFLPIQKYLLYYWVPFISINFPQKALHFPASMWTNCSEDLLTSFTQELPCTALLSEGSTLFSGFHVSSFLVYSVILLGSIFK